MTVSAELLSDFLQRNPSNKEKLQFFSTLIKVFFRNRETSMYHPTKHITSFSQF